MTIALPRIQRLPQAERGITIGDFLVPIRIGERISSRYPHLALILLGVIVFSLSTQTIESTPSSSGWRRLIPAASSP